MPIPPLDADTGYLPFESEEPIATDLDEVRLRFATNERRARLWQIFTLWCRELDDVGYPGTLRLSGSFVTAKPSPGDIDVAVALPPDALLVAQEIVVPHLWTWQNVGTLGAGPDGGGLSWQYLTKRLQPALAVVDAHRFAIGTAIAAAFARDWTSEYDENRAPTGIRKAWLGVER